MHWNGIGFLERWEKGGNGLFREYLLGGGPGRFALEKSMLQFNVRLRTATKGGKKGLFSTGRATAFSIGGGGGTGGSEKPGDFSS